ncbi:MAG: DUF167 domain-containing protein [Patescibacteria group bacterium]
MLINIRVIPRAKKERVLETEKGLRIYVNAPPEDGRANNAVVNLLSEHFKIPKTLIKIFKGEKSRKKIIEIFQSKNRD